MADLETGARFLEILLNMLKNCWAWQFDMFIMFLRID